MDDPPGRGDLDLGCDSPGRRDRPCLRPSSVKGRSRRHGGPRPGARDDRGGASGIGRIGMTATSGERVMQVLERSVYRGPHLYSATPMVRIRLDLGRMEDWPTDRLGDFSTRLLEALPGLDRHGCCYGEPGGFVRRLRDGTWFGHVAEYVALELQTRAGTPVTRGKTRSVRGQPGVYDILFTYRTKRRPFWPDGWPCRFATPCCRKRSLGSAAWTGSAQTVWIRASRTPSRPTRRRPFSATRCAGRRSAPLPRLWSTPRDAEGFPSNVSTPGVSCAWDGAPGRGACAPA